MSTATLSDVQANDDSPDWFVVDNAEPEPAWGRFLQLRACKHIRNLTTGNTQHIGLVLALLTPPDGKLFVAQKDIAADTRRGHTTVATAIKELCALGILMKAKRTMGGFDVVWGKVAYGITVAHDSPDVGQRAEKICFRI